MTASPLHNQGKERDGRSPGRYAASPHRRSRSTGRDGGSGTVLRCLVAMRLQEPGLPGAIVRVLTEDVHNVLLERVTLVVDGGCRRSPQPRAGPSSPTSGAASTMVYRVSTLVRQDPKLDGDGLSYLKDVWNAANRLEDVAHPLHHILLYGPTGTGKTHLVFGPRTGQQPPTPGLFECLCRRWWGVGSHRMGVLGIFGSSLFNVNALHTAGTGTVRLRSDGKGNEVFEGVQEVELSGVEQVGPMVGTFGGFVATRPTTLNSAGSSRSHTILYLRDPAEAILCSCTDLAGSEPLGVDVPSSREKDQQQQPRSAVVREETKHLNTDLLQLTTMLQSPGAAGHGRDSTLNRVLRAVCLQQQTRQLCCVIGTVFNNADRRRTGPTAQCLEYIAKLNNTAVAGGGTIFRLADGARVERDWHRLVQEQVRARESLVQTEHAARGVVQLGEVREWFEDLVLGYWLARACPFSLAGQGLPGWFGKLYTAETLLRTALEETREREVQHLFHACSELSEPVAVAAADRPVQQQRFPSLGYFLRSLEVLREAFACGGLHTIEGRRVFAFFHLSWMAIVGSTLDEVMASQSYTFEATHMVPAPGDHRFRLDVCTTFQERPRDRARQGSIVWNFLLRIGLGEATVTGVPVEEVEAFRARRFAMGYRLDDDPRAATQLHHHYRMTRVTSKPTNGTHTLVLSAGKGRARPRPFEYVHRPQSWLEGITSSRNGVSIWLLVDDESAAAAV